MITVDVNIYDDKLDKQTVHYGKSTGNDCCDVCMHFTPPHDCEVVSGLVDRDGWCDHFRQK